MQTMVLLNPLVLAAPTDSKDLECLHQCCRGSQTNRPRTCMHCCATFEYVWREPALTCYMTQMPSFRQNTTKITTDSNCSMMPFATGQTLQLSIPTCLSSHQTIALQSCLPMPLLGLLLFQINSRNSVACQLHTTATELRRPECVELLHLLPSSIPLPPIRAAFKH